MSFCILSGAGWMAKWGLRSWRPSYLSFRPIPSLERGWAARCSQWCSGAPNPTKYQRTASPMKHGREECGGMNSITLVPSGANTMLPIPPPCGPTTTAASFRCRCPTAIPRNGGGVGRRIRNVVVGLICQSRIRPPNPPLPWRPSSTEAKSLTTSTRPGAHTSRSAATTASSFWTDRRTHGARGM